MEGVVISAEASSPSAWSQRKGDSASRPASCAGDSRFDPRGRLRPRRPSTVTIAGDSPLPSTQAHQGQESRRELSNSSGSSAFPARAEKRALTGCTNCHTVERILNFEYTAERCSTHQAMARIRTTASQEAQIRASARHHRFVPNADKVAAYSQHQPQQGSRATAQDRAR